MTLVAPEPEAPPARAVPLIDSANTKVIQVQPQTSAMEVRAEIATMIQRLPDSADAQILREEFTAIHQHLTGVTDRHQANTIVGEGMLSIADRLDTTTNAVLAVRKPMIDLRYQ
jgi:hypothetical protein